ncbi:MAG: anthranilate phosphoribosyltransferase [Bacteroidales bacterium]
MKQILNKLLESQKLSRSEAQDLIHNIASGNINESQMSAMLTAYIMRNISLEELQGFRDALLDLALPVDINGGQTIDLCGTGGDGKNTFNISTVSAFVVAGAGVPVAKHGNYGVSSVTGSSNLMEILGYKFSTSAEKLKREIDSTNVCFLHAPLFHPALKTIGPIRRQLGVKTFFNILGPLVNPARPKYQVSGVFNIEVGRTYSYLLNNHLNDFRIVHSLDGYDEISLTGPAKVFSKQGDSCLTPENFGFRKVASTSIEGGANPDESAKIFLSILNNKADKEKIDVTIANSAMAINCYKGIALGDAILVARESIESGKALKSFKKIISMQ